MKFMEGIVGNGGLVGFAVASMVGKLTPDRRKVVADSLKAWLRDDARKAARQDLQLLLDEFGKRIDTMVADLDIQIVDDKPVVTVVGQGRDTLRALERGTNWFDPCEDVVSVVISSLWES
ncbi:MAG: hypothetical protein ACOYB3_00815 [Azonexus sp.]